MDKWTLIFCAALALWLTAKSNDLAEAGLISVSNSLSHKGNQNDN